MSTRGNVGTRPRQQRRAVTVLLCITVSWIASCGSPDRVEMATPVSVRTLNTNGIVTTEPDRDPLHTGEPDPGPPTTVAPTTNSTVTNANAADATPITRPLTTAPPSPLLAQIDTIYRDAYADLLAAEAIPDEYFPPLAEHMAPGQLEQWRSVIRGLRQDGHAVRPSTTKEPWIRVEEFTQPSASLIQLTVCRFDPELTIDAFGTTIGFDTRPYRYVETFEMTEGRWRWSQREWVDPSGYSDCAQP